MVLFQGKRAAQRVKLEIPVACSAATGAPVAAKTVDVSTTGTLLRLADPKALGIEPMAPLTELAARIAMRFPGGMLLRFQRSMGELKARVVRVARPPPPDAGVLVGVRFEVPLSEAEALRVGLPTASDVGVPAAPPPPPPPEPAPAGGGLPFAPTIQVGPRVERESARPRPPGISIVGAASPMPAPAPTAPSAHAAPPATLSEPHPGPFPTAPPVGPHRPEGLPASPRPLVAPHRPTGDVHAPAGTGACPTDVLVYLFPAHAATPTARVRARKLGGDGLDLFAELVLRPDEEDPMGVGAFLGEEARLVLVHEGRVAYDGPVHVERMIAEAGGVLRLLLKAEHPLPVAIAPARRGPQPADVSARQVTRT